MGKQARVLTIEDEPSIRKGIVAYLEDSGFLPLEAADGPAGLDLFEREHPDAVLCDLRLPGMDGLEVLSAITRSSPETPVVIVSGVSLLSYAVEALRRGAWDYVTKPIQDMAVLESALQRVLERADLIRQNRVYRERLEALNRELTATVHQLQEDEEAGRAMQSRLLPDARRAFGEYELRSRLYPSMYLSGDFVDYFVLPRGRVGFYMADVSGHGAASAFVTVMLKTLVGRYRQALARDGDQTILHPERTLARLNRDLRQEDLDKYLTIFYGVIDRHEHVMVCCSGGHFPYAILHDGLEARHLAIRGRPVGLFEEAEYQAHSVDLPERFVLLLASDGALELIAEDPARSKLETLRAMARYSTTALEDLAAELELESAWQPPDDVTLLTVARGWSHD